MTRVLALVGDLMDRSRISAAVAEATFVRSATDIDFEEFDVVLVDLVHAPTAVQTARAASATIRIVAFGPHVGGGALSTAASAGANVVMARSKFFRDVRSATFGGATDK